MTLQASGQIDFSDINVELGRSATAQLGLGSDAGARTLSGVGTVGTQIRLGADFYSKSNFTLTSPTPGGSVYTETVVPITATATLTVGPNGTMNGTAYGSPTGANVSASKHWKWTQVSGSAPNAGTNITVNTWSPCSSSLILQMQRLTPTGTRSGVVAISFANDASGTGETTAGNWTITAYVAP